MQAYLQLSITIYCFLCGRNATTATLSHLVFPWPRSHLLLTSVGAASLTTKKGARRSACVYRYSSLRRQRYIFNGVSKLTSTTALKVLWDQPYVLHLQLVFLYQPFYFIHGAFRYTLALQVVLQRYKQRQLTRVSSWRHTANLILVP